MAEVVVEVMYNCEEVIVEQGAAGSEFDERRPGCLSARLRVSRRLLFSVTPLANSHAC